MKIGDTLYFSPNHAFRDLDFTNSDQIALAFQDRVDGFYFAPAARSITSSDAFAAGLVIFAGVEFVAFTTSESGASDWLADNLKIDATVTAKIWEYFRHGLSHEGRVKASAQFSFETGDVVVETDGVFVINPARLLEGVRTVFHERCARMDPNRKKLLTERLRRHFEREARAARP
jgi:hypothetical protein